MAWSNYLLCIKGLHFLSETQSILVGRGIGSERWRGSSRRWLHLAARSKWIRRLPPWQLRPMLGSSTLSGGRWLAVLPLSSEIRWPRLTASTSWAKIRNWSSRASCRSASGQTPRTWSRFQYQTCTHPSTPAATWGTQLAAVGFLWSLWMLASGEESSSF